MRSWKERLQSRKFIMSVVSALLLVANEGLALGIPENVVLPFALLVVGWVLGESYVDAHK